MAHVGVEGAELGLLDGLIEDDRDHLHIVCFNHTILFTINPTRLAKVEEATHITQTGRLVHFVGEELIDQFVLCRRSDLVEEGTNRLQQKLQQDE